MGISATGQGRSYDGHDRSGSRVGGKYDGESSGHVLDGLSRFLPGSDWAPLSE